MQSIHIGKSSDPVDLLLDIGRGSLKSSLLLTTSKLVLFLRLVRSSDNASGEDPLSFLVFSAGVIHAGYTLRLMGAGGDGGGVPSHSMMTSGSFGGGMILSTVGIVSFSISPIATLAGMDPMILSALAKAVRTLIEYASSSST